MKIYFASFLFLLTNISFGQVTNVKSGVWSDPTVWNNNTIPTGTTNIILSYNIHIDINASCKSLNTNGHHVTVGLGNTFNVMGVAPPVAGFTFGGPFVVPATVTFTNTSTKATTYLWNFGDTASGVNNTSTAVNPTHFYKTLAPYLTNTIVKLTATGPGGVAIDSQYIGLSCVPQIVEVGPTIDTPTTWDQCHIYHCKSYVSVNAPLTIEGATVTFDLQKGMIVQGNGKLISRNAVFTSSASSKKYGDWANISFGTTSGNSITGGAIQYAGYASLNLERALNMGSGINNTVTKVIFEYNSGTLNQRTATLDMSRCPKSSVASQNLFFSNSGHPVLIGIATDFDNTNQFSFNQSNAIYVDCVDIDQAHSITWTNKQVPYVLGGWSSNSWSFDPGKILILGDSVVLKFARYTNPGFSIFIPNGTSQIQNYNGLGVVFTSYNDDSWLGDSNGDGPSAGTAGFWEGIQTTGPVWYSWPNIYFAAH
ncbi:MAG: PKD domain-containing protein [Ferruginibacter sp.]